MFIVVVRFGIKMYLLNGPHTHYDLCEAYGPFTSIVEAADCEDELEEKYKNRTVRINVIPLISKEVEVTNVQS